MTNFSKTERVTARVHPSVKRKLDESKYNARHAIEWFVAEITNEKKALDIEEHVLIQERECYLKEVARVDKELEKIRIQRKEKYGGDISELQKDAYIKIISKYSDYSHGFKDHFDTNKESFEDFIQHNYIKQIIINDLSNLDCPFDDYVEGLIQYYHDGRQVSQTS